jgi:hypothetical protein
MQKKGEVDANRCRTRKARSVRGVRERDRDPTHTGARTQTERERDNADRLRDGD